VTSFTWKDGERTIRFGRGSAQTAGELLGSGYLLLTTERARGTLPAVEDAAAEVLDVAAGFVDEVAAELLPRVQATGGSLVALGGGRVIDTAKALGAGTGRAGAPQPPTPGAAPIY
jgi:hypothetical protein